MTRDQTQEQRQDSQAEARLVANFAAGDLAAAAALVQRLGPRLIGFARRMLQSDPAEAEDIAQEVLMRLWAMAPTWRDEGISVSAWAFKVASNLCLDRLRRGTRRGPPLEDIPEPQDDAPSALARLAQADREAALGQALALLPERQRQAVILRHIEGLANPEIAAIMGCAIEAVESLTARGRRGLQAALAGQREALGAEDESERSHV